MRPIFLTMFYRAPHPFVLNSRRKHRALYAPTELSTQRSQSKGSSPWHTVPTPYPRGSGEGSVRHIGVSTLSCFEFYDSGGAGRGACSAMMARACSVRSSFSLGVKILSPLIHLLIRWV